MDSPSFIWLNYFSSTLYHFLISSLRITVSFYGWTREKLYRYQHTYVIHPVQVPPLVQQGRHYLQLSSANRSLTTKGMSQAMCEYLSSQTTAWIGESISYSKHPELLISFRPVWYISCLRNHKDFGNSSIVKNIYYCHRRSKFNS